LTQNRQFEAIIVGASLGGLASAAILAKRGYKVCVVETLEHPGGRVGALEFNGYWIDFGHRDGHGIGDACFSARYMIEAANAAGIELSVRRAGTGMRMHRLGLGTFVDMPSDGGAIADPQVSAAELVQVLTGATDGVDEAAAEFVSTMGKLSSIDEDEAWRLVPMPLGEWLTRNVTHALTRNAILQLVECMYPSPAENTSVGRYILFMRHANREGAIYPDDNEAGGMQGVIAPWVRAIEKNGGELWLGWKPVEIVVESRKVRGIVALDEHSFVEVIEAPVVITDYHGWDLSTLVDEDLLPEGFVDTARRLQRYGADFVSWWAGLSKLPTRRVDGQVEDMPGWHRVLYGDQAVKRYHGGFHFTSAYSARAAPPGKHLLNIAFPHWGEGDGRRWRRWSDAKFAIDRTIDYLRTSYYVDLEECIEWNRYQWESAPQILTWCLKPVYRHPVKVATIEGLYLASSTTEGLGTYVDIECAAALEAVYLIETEMGHLRST
jgi:phytoene dehydrogenase-like protein